MSYEIISTLIILALVCLILVILDLAISATLAIALGITFKKAFCWGLLSCLLPVFAMVYGAAIERNHARVTNIELEFPNLPQAFDGYRIAQLSDIHTRSFMSRPKTLAKMVDKVNAQNPDLIAFTGDIITMDSDELQMSAPILRNLSAPDGIVSILGNHDYGIYMDPRKGPQAKENCARDVAATEREMGWNILLDSNLRICHHGDSLSVVGVEYTSPSPHFKSYGNLGAASEGTDGTFRILLSHDPMHWDMEVVGNDYPLMLAGHTHAIQFSLFGWCPSRYMFKQYRGLYKNGQQRLYVNVGLGETIMPFRIGVPPEITIITLRKS